MQIVQQVLFVLLSGFSIWYFIRNMKRLRRNIFLGKKQDINDHKKERWRNVLLLAMGQKKMFKKPLVAVMHFIIYAGFIIINVEILEIILDGITGQHRMFAPLLGGFYSFLINCFEILAALVLLVCVVFLIRRNIIKIPRLVTGQLAMGWPKIDGNLILILEIILMGLFLSMNATDLALQDIGADHYVQTDTFIVSGMLKPLFAGLSMNALIGLERAFWWLHIAGIFFFMNYLYFSKHLHVILAFPNAFYSKLTGMGGMSNMPAIQNEIKYMMQPELAPTGADANPIEAGQRFGAKDATDLPWTNLLDAYACTECGRCTSACPANQTGKKLSPRKIMMDTRDRIQEIGSNIDKNGEFVDDGKTLLNDYITVEELRACTTCNACVEECPVSIEPLSIINELRRYLVMEESNSPTEWNLMFSNIENNMAPWKFSPDDRDAWAND
jgi:heterodisulfide reductase subunit C